MSKSRIIIKPVRTDIIKSVSMELDFETDDAIRIMTYALQLYAHRQAQAQKEITVTGNVEHDLERSLQDLKK